jgi:hypothetical protein
MHPASHPVFGLVPGFVRLFHKPDAPGGDAGTGSATNVADTADDSPTAPTGIAAAGKAFLAGLSADQANAELPDPDVGDDLDAAAEEGAAPEGATAAITREDGASWKVELGRWVDASGKMVAGEPPEGAPTKAAAPAPVADVAAESEPDAEGTEEPTGEWQKVTLPGLAESGETDLEIETDDPAIIERINRLKKEGLRRAEYNKRLAALEEQHSELAAVTDTLDADPVGFIVNQLTPERQLEVAQALLVERFEDLVPLINRFAEAPEARHEERVTLRDKMRDSERELATTRQHRELATKCIRAAESLIPEGTDEAVASDFISDARQILAAAAKSGTTVSPDAVPQLLARRVELYGFKKDVASPPVSDRGTAPAKPAAAAPVVPPKKEPPAARPLTDRAKEVAARAPATEDARTAQARLRRTQERRAAATRVAPTGVGTAPVQVPVLKPEDQVSIKAASRAIRAKIGSNWPAPTQ